MKNSVMQRSPALALGLLLLTLAMLLLVRLPFLVVADVNGRPVAFFSLALTKGFSLHYIHSVQRTPVIENFTLDRGDSLLLTSTEYRSLGVGLPFLQCEGKLENRGGRFYLAGLNRHFGEISLGVSPIAGQALVLRGRRIELNSYFSPNSVAKIRVVRCSSAHMLWQRFIH